jgi:hypothetical protein
MTLTRMISQNTHVDGSALFSIPYFVTRKASSAEKMLNPVKIRGITM